MVGSSRFSKNGNRGPKHAPPELLLKPKTPYGWKSGPEAFWKYPPHFMGSSWNCKGSGRLGSPLDSTCFMALMRLFTDLGKSKYNNIFTSRKTTALWTDLQYIPLLVPASPPPCRPLRNPDCRNYYNRIMEKKKEATVYGGYHIHIYIYIYWGYIGVYMGLMEQKNGNYFSI